MVVDKTEPSLEPINIWQTVTVQSAILGLILIVGGWVAPTSIWQGTQSINISLEFIAALLAIMVAISGIIRYIALGQRLVMLFGLSFLGAGLADLLNASVSLDVIATGEGADPATWTAGRLTHGLLLLASLAIGRYAPRARRINLELAIAFAVTITITVITISTLSRYSSDLLITRLPPLRRVTEWALIPLFLWAAWGYFQLFIETRSSFLDWAAGAGVICGVSQVYASLFMDWDEGTIFIPHALKVFGYVAALSGLYMENLALFKETERQRDALDVQNQNLERNNEQLATLLDVSRVIAETREVDALPQTVLDKTAELIPQAETGIVFLYDPINEYLVPRATRRFQYQILSSMRIQPDESFIGRVFSSGQSYIGNSPDEVASELASLDDVNKRFLDQASEGMQPIQESICAPLIEHGETRGVMMLNNYSTANPFTDSQISFFQTLCNQVAGAIRNAQLYVEVRQYATQLRSKNQELEGFVYTASHDLRSPLVSLHGLMAMFTKSIGPKLDDRGRRYITRLEANVSQMEELIDGLLELSRVGRAEIKLDDVDMDKLLQVLAEQLRPQLEKSEIELTVHPLPRIVAPELHVKQIFSNLISNAIKFMGDSTDRRIEVGGSRDNGDATLYVQDTGIGIDPAYHEKIFEIFQRLKELEEVKGTGVGLAIVRKIIDNLGGQIRIESEKGKGARFLINLPILEPSKAVETVKAGAKA